MKPTIGRIVWYRTDGRNGLVYDLPAIITVTQETHPGDYPSGEKNPLPVPSSHTHVHLTVFTPGGFGTKIHHGFRAPERLPEDDAEFKKAKAIYPGSGTYVEWNVPFYEPPESRVPDDPRDKPTPRSWRWPEIVR